jgi:hypothetical protein
MRNRKIERVLNRTSIVCLVILVLVNSRYRANTSSARTHLSSSDVYDEKRAMIEEGTIYAREAETGAAGEEELNDLGDASTNEYESGVTKSGEEEEEEEEDDDDDDDDVRGTAKTTTFSDDFEDDDEEDKKDNGALREPIVENPTSMTNLARAIAKKPFDYRVEDLFLTNKNHRRLQPKDGIRFPKKNLEIESVFGGGDKSESEHENAMMKYYKSCAVVLNSGVMTMFGDKKQGERIDMHDAVFRVNQAPTKYFEKFVGKKTTLRILNKKWTQILSHRMGKSLLFQDPPGAALVATRAKAIEFEHLASIVRKERPDGDVKVYSLAHGVVTRARWTLHAFREGVGRLRPSKRKKFKESPGLSPSSGFIAIYIARHLCAKVAVYGMSLERSWEGDSLRAPYHYFTTMDGRHSVMDSIQLRAHESHSFDLEGELVKAWSEAGVVRLCDPLIKRQRLCQVYEETR